MSKVFMLVVAVALLGAGCVANKTNTNQAVETTGSMNANANSNANTNVNSGSNTNANTNAPAASGSVNVNAEVDAILKDTEAEQANESSGDESDLTTAETLDLNAMIGAPGNY